MNQETLGNIQTPEKSQEHISNFVDIAEQMPQVHDDKCCSGTCEVAWKPGRVSQSS